MTPGETLQAYVGAFVDELARSGIRHACLCPGSRSAPLALLLGRRPGIRVWTHLDERPAAFFALGMAKALREPVAVVSTSGTAAVNFAPAVVEAYYARVSLLILTADRPPELRDVGANQTIDQARLYGPHVAWFSEMLLPEPSEEALRYARTMACRAVAASRGDVPGPVHLNFPFREPLAPARTAETASVDTSETPYLAAWQAPRRPAPEDIGPIAEELRTARRGLIVCGPQDSAAFPETVMRLAQELGYPVLADPLSQVRCGPHHGPLVIDAYDSFLRDGETRDALAPDIVLRFGAAPSSKPLLAYLQQHGSARQLFVDAGRWTDPLLVASGAIQADPASFCRALSMALEQHVATAKYAPEEWARRWRALDQRTRAALSKALPAGELSEPGVFAELARLLPAESTLFAGNSMPVRDLDAFFPGSERPLRFMANRGASGIDGVVSTALGVSAVTSAPLTLVIGDLSFYHDMNGLLAAMRFGLRATIVLLNNDGGGIFSLLPQAGEERFEELFGMPHGLDFRHAAEMYGLAYRRAQCRDDFRSEVQESFASDGVTVVEVRTEREANARLHREIWDSVSNAVRTSAPERET